MIISDLMTRNVKSVRADDSLNTAAQYMWDFDCGCIPVLNEDEHLVGLITDRDICIAAYTQGKPIQEVRVEEAMAWEVFSCLPDDTLSEAQAIMRQRKVRRLPVIDLDGTLVGLISLNDIARESAREQSQRKKDVTLEEVGATLSAICQARTQQQVPLSS